MGPPKFLVKSYLWLLRSSIVDFWEVCPALVLWIPNNQYYARSPDVKLSLLTVKINEIKSHICINVNLFWIVKLIRKTFFVEKTENEFRDITGSTSGIDLQIFYCSRIKPMINLIPFFDTLRAISRLYLVPQFLCQITISRDSEVRSLG